MVQTDSTSTDWFLVDIIRCQCEGGHPPMQDKVMGKIVTIVMTCDTCGLSYFDTSTHNDTVHWR